MLSVHSVFKYNSACDCRDPLQMESFKHPPCWSVFQQVTVSSHTVEGHTSKDYQLNVTKQQDCTVALSLMHVVAFGKSARLSNFLQQQKSYTQDQDKPGLCWIDQWWSTVSVWLCCHVMLESARVMQIANIITEAQGTCIFHSQAKEQFTNFSALSSSRITPGWLSHLLFHPEDIPIDPLQM